MSYFFRSSRLIFLLTLFLVTSLQAEEEQEYFEFPEFKIQNYSISIFRHNIRLPYEESRVDVTQRNLGFTGNIEFWRRQGWLDFLNGFNRIELGYYDHANLNKGYFSEFVFGGSYASPYHFELSWLAGFGYLRAFSNEAIYRLNDDGEYDHARDYGHGSFYIAPAVQLITTPFPNNWVVSSVFIQYKLLVELGFSNGERTQLMPHEMISLGLQW